MTVEESGKTPAGWYPDQASGLQRWWDGSNWTEKFQPAAQVPVPVQTDTRKARDKAQYTREQKGHSLILWILFGAFLLYIPVIYYSVSPNHYWHA